EFAVRDPDEYLVIFTEPTSDPPSTTEPSCYSRLDHVPRHRLGAQAPRRAWNHLADVALYI
ncbi:MAG: hypothetical protein ACE5LB_17305, partial [Acidiferrobacterales bacterium]